MLLVAWRVWRARQGEYGRFIRFAVLAIPFAFTGSRAAFCLTNLSYYLETIGSAELMLHVLDGGASMTGALLGILAAAFLAEKWQRLPSATLMDAAAFGMPAALLIERLAEPLCELGWGKYYQSSLFDFAANLTDGMHPVFLYEALAAAAIGVGLVCLTRRRKAVRGDVICLFLLLYGCTQTLLESLRNDGHMKVIHFVRVNQVAAIVLAVAALVAWTIRASRRGATRALGVTWALAAVCIVFGVVQEFAADGGENPYFSYPVVSSCLMGALALAGAAWACCWRRQVRVWPIPAAILVALALLCTENCTDTGSARLFFVYGIMAAGLFIIAYAALSVRKLSQKE